MLMWAECVQSDQVQLIIGCLGAEKHQVNGSLANWADGGGGTRSSTASNRPKKATSQRRKKEADTGPFLSRELLTSSELMKAEKKELMHM
jgi:hypothetical protein